jgi:tetratricopeptide (TPR) repeat protein
LETQIYQAILERNPAPVIPKLKEILSQPHPTLGYYNGELRFWLGWAQQVAGDVNAAQASWREARSELEPLLKDEPENFSLMDDLALIHAALGEKADALALTERAMALIPLEKDALNGPQPIEILARVSAQLGEPDRALAALEKLLVRPYSGPLASGSCLRPRFSALIQCSIRCVTIRVSKSCARSSAMKPKHSRRTMICPRIHISLTRCNSAYVSAFAFERLQPALNSAHC